MKTKGRQTGISIIEMLMAMLSAAILALTVGIMLVTSYRGWADNNKYIRLQEEASLAQTLSERWIRESSYWEVSATNAVLSITASSVTKRLFSSAGSLIYDPNISVAGDELMVASNHVFSFTPRSVPTGVYMDLWLRDGAINAELHTFISYRN